MIWHAEAVCDADFGAQCEAPPLRKIALIRASCNVIGFVGRSGKQAPSDTYGGKLTHK